MGGGDFGSGSGSKFNCAARVGSGSGFSFEPVQTSTPHTDVSRNLATVVVRGVLPGLREEELDCCPVVQSPLFR